MANVALFRSGQLPQYLTSVETSIYAADGEAIVNPDVSAVIAVAVKYWKRSGNTILEMTAGEKTTQDAAIASSLLSVNRSLADAIKDVSSGDGIHWRALALMLLDEFNVLRQWTVDFKAAVAASTNLANLQTRVAALSTLGDRTMAQVKTVYSNKISGGSAD